MAHVQKFKYKGKTNLIPDIENVINKSSDNLWMDDESLFVDPRGTPINAVPAGRYDK